MKSQEFFCDDGISKPLSVAFFIWIKFLFYYCQLGMLSEKKGKLGNIPQEAPFRNPLLKEIHGPFCNFRPKEQISLLLIGTEKITSSRLSINCK